MNNSSSDQPLISVVMSVYNDGNYVAEAMESILGQTYRCLEFIVAVDEGSSDRSLDIVRAFAARDPRVRLTTVPHCGAAGTANAGVALAAGELIARMDPDDVALPQRFAMQLQWMRRTGVDICGSCVSRIGAGDGLMWFPETHEAIRHELLFRIGLLQPTVLMRADILRAHPYDERSTFEDYELWTRLALLYRMGNMPAVLLKSRIHDRQLHIVKGRACLDDFHRFRQRYFHQLFPQAGEADHAALARVDDKQPFSSLAELELAGRWLVRLAQTPEPALTRRMAERWLHACMLSAQLGPGCYRVYRKIELGFGLSTPLDASTLLAACALRLKPGSRLDTGLRRLKSKLPR